MDENEQGRPEPSRLWREAFRKLQALWDADMVNFHPLTNTATTALAQDEFRRFLSLIEREPVGVDFGRLRD